MIRYSLRNECYICTSPREERGEVYPLSAQHLPLPPACQRWKLIAPVFVHLKSPLISCQSLQLLSLLFLPQVCLSYFPFKNLQDPINLGISSIPQANILCCSTWEIGSKVMLTTMGSDSLGKTIQKNSIAQSWDTCRMQVPQGNLDPVLPSFWGYLGKVSLFSDTTVIHHLCAHMKKHHPTLCKSSESKLGF